MKLVFLDFGTLGAVDVSGFDTFGEVVRYTSTPASQTAERIGDARIVITNKVVIDDEVMRACPGLRLICVAATGVNNIDLEAARTRGIAVANVAGYSTESVVAQTFAIYFDLAHHNRYYDTYGKTTWHGSDSFTHHDRPFYELAGKRWGIIGLGSIGTRVAEVAQAFGCKVCYYSTAGIDRDSRFERLELEALLERCDIVSIHAPLNEATRGLIGASELARMKSSAIVLNLGRGGIVDETALADAVENETIRAAGLDVMEQEPPARENKLFKINKSYNTFISPHIAWASVEARGRLVAMIHKNIEAFLQNQKLNRVV